VNLPLLSPHRLSSSLMVPSSMWHAFCMACASESQPMRWMSPTCVSTMVTGSFSGVTATDWWCSILAAPLRSWSVIISLYTNWGCVVRKWWVSAG
jgi:hypothetical protein